MTYEPDHRERYIRSKAFDGPIEHVARNNPLVAQIINLYVTGAIVTKEEALSQMVVQLSTDWSQIQKRAYEILNASPSTLMPRVAR